MIDLYIDNNVWDLLFDLGLDLRAELPPGEFRILIPASGIPDLLRGPPHVWLCLSRKPPCR